ncbi:hypothetical protein JOB18_044777 [Solea senegalensis]|uniref:Uncharacterized protein n=1 Tax=Solea senegalensis TaxID=28829 RepID=A0AAV6PMM9_SOLSE|nr:hypothetical protein JOB18_044777 [Solea senegalensis]
MVWSQTDECDALHLWVNLPPIHGVRRPYASSTASYLWAINRVASSCSPGDYCVNRSAAVFGVVVSGMKSEDTEVVRELIIKGLCVYLHEDPAHLFMEYESEDHAAIQDGIGDTTVGIFLIRQNGGSEVEDILVVLEGQAILVDLPSVGVAVAMP